MRGRLRAVVALAATAVGLAHAAAAPAYPVHTGIVATVFWIGEPVGNGSSENNALSAWDDSWEAHYGGFDEYRAHRVAPFFPSFVPKENPFYLDLPYNDFDDQGQPRANRTAVIPWARRYASQVAAARRAGHPYSLMKNRWVELWRMVGGARRTCYGQIEDSGPYVYTDTAYVFGAGDRRPASKRANNAGLDVSPALRDCLRFPALNDDTARVDWRFVERNEVPPGPWTKVVTTRQVYWP